MLEEINFVKWASRLNLSDKSEKYILKIRNSEPSRRVSSGRGSVSGRFPSRKMGFTIQFESHKNELAYIYILEHDKKVFEYYDQPSQIPIKYTNLKGRKIGFNHTPDFFIINSDWAGWVECKTEEQLLELAVKQPNRFSLNEYGDWVCPPGESYASQFGFEYRVWSSKNINKTYQQNIEYLEDYFRTNLQLTDDKTNQKIITKVSDKFGISLSELYEELEDVITRDEILSLISKEQIFVDLYDSPLSSPESAKVFISKEAATAYSSIFQLNLPFHEKPFQPQIVEVEIGKPIIWDAKVWKISNFGASNITLIDDSSALSEIPIRLFEELVRIGKIKGLQTVKENTSKITNLLKSASSEYLAQANFRQSVVLAFLQGAELSSETPIRTVNRWVKNYKLAEITLGYGYLGLITKQRVGNTVDKLSAESREILQKFILESYESLKQKTKSVVYGEYKLACDSSDIEAVSYKTFIKWIKNRPKAEQVLKRQGRRASYQEQPFYWYLEKDTPRHGEHPFHIVHIDYTEIDLELIDSYTKKEMGKAWLGLATSASTRRILAVYITFDAPSRSSDMMLLRELVRKHGRMPQIIVVDGGKNFEGTYFETLLAFFECTKKTRPPAEPRFGSVIERVFGTANTQFFHNLQGNTQIMKLVRQVTKSVNPKNHAIWTLPKLWEYLCIYCYEIYDTTEHASLGQSPREAFEMQNQLHGQRSHRLIPYDENFKLLTLPTTLKGTAKIVPRLGVKINYIYYWNDSFYNPRVENTQVEVRFDPFNVGKAYVYLKSEWIECYSEYYSVFNGISEKSIKLITKELTQRKRNHAKKFSISASNLASFIRSAEGEEILLKQQLADNEQKYIFQTINNETVSTSNIIIAKPTVEVPQIPVKSLKSDKSSNEENLSTEVYKTFEETFNV